MPDTKVLLRGISDDALALIRNLGELEIDEDCFPDDDEVRETTIVVDTDWRVDAVPNGFVWSCCELRGRNAKPCLRSRHSRSYRGEERGKVYRLAENGAYETDDDSD